MTSVFIPVQKKDALKQWTNNRNIDFSHTRTKMEFEVAADQAAF